MSVVYEITTFDGDGREQSTYVEAPNLAMMCQTLAQCGFEEIARDGSLWAGFTGGGREISAMPAFFRPVWHMRHISEVDCEKKA
jgi:hypothetical protein